MAKRRVVVTGMGLVSCFGMDVDKFYAKLLAGESGVREIKAFDVSEYPTRIAAEVTDFDCGDYIDKKQARRIDPFMRYATVAGKRALEHSQVSLDELDKERCGILISSGMGGMTVFQEGVETLVTKGYKRLSPFFVPYIITNMASGLLAIDLGFMGPNYSISTACATSNYAIYAAANHIRHGEADLMICGGSEASINPIGLAGFVACKALSTNNEKPQEASRPWDKARDGFVMGEGSGTLILEDLEHAKKRGAPILAEYLGGGISCDGYHMTSPREDGAGVALCMKNAFKDANIDPKVINYINAHATSTMIGDMCEIEGMRSAFGDQMDQIKINGIKSMIGHCLGAASAIEAIATIQAILTGQLAPTINIENPEEGLGNIDIIANQAKEHAITAAMNNSFGFGGHNSSVIFAPYKE